MNKQLLTLRTVLALATDFEMDLTEVDSESHQLIHGASYEGYSDVVAFLLNLEGQDGKRVNPTAKDNWTIRWVSIQRPHMFNGVHDLLECNRLRISRRTYNTGYVLLMVKRIIGKGI